MPHPNLAFAAAAETGPLNGGRPTIVPRGYEVWVNGENRAFKLQAGISSSQGVTYAPDSDPAGHPDAGLYEGATIPFEANPDPLLFTTDGAGDLFRGTKRLTSGHEFGPNLAFGSHWISDSSGNLWEAERDSARKANGPVVLPNREIGWVFTDTEGVLWQSGHYTDPVRKDGVLGGMKLAPNQYEIAERISDVNAAVGDDGVLYREKSAGKMEKTSITGLTPGTAYSLGDAFIADGTGTLWNCISHSSCFKFTNGPKMKPGTSAMHASAADTLWRTFASDVDGILWQWTTDESWTQDKSGLKTAPSQMVTPPVVNNSDENVNELANQVFVVGTDGYVRVVGYISKGWQPERAVIMPPARPAASQMPPTTIACSPQTGDPAASARQRVSMLMGGIVFALAFVVARMRWRSRHQL